MRGVLAPPTFERCSCQLEPSKKQQSKVTPCGLPLSQIGEVELNLRKWISVGAADARLSAGRGVPLKSAFEPWYISHELQGRRWIDLRPSPWRQRVRRSCFRREAAARDRKSVV